MSYQYAIGSTLEGMVNLSDLTPAIPAPRAYFRLHAETLPSPGGGVFGVGWSSCEWLWGFLSAAQRQALRAFCADLAATVYIRTTTNEVAEGGGYTYQAYQARMLWPDDENIDAGRRLEFRLQFQELIAEVES